VVVTPSGIPAEIAGRDENKKGLAHPVEYKTGETRRAINST